MKFNNKDLISRIIKNNSKQLQPNIELADCPLKAMLCEVQLASIHISLFEYEKYRIEKKYEKSVEILKNAFEKTLMLKNNPCTKCANHYHQIIFETMEIIINELNKPSNSLFSKKNNHPIYFKAQNIFIEMKNNLTQFNYYKLTESKIKFLGNYLN